MKVALSRFDVRTSRTGRNLSADFEDDANVLKAISLVTANNMAMTITHSEMYPLNTTHGVARLLFLLHFFVVFFL
jgi:hypothetical protein